MISIIEKSVIEILSLSRDSIAKMSRIIDKYILAMGTIEFFRQSRFVLNQ